MEFTDPRFGVARYPVMILIKNATTEKRQKALFLLVFIDESIIYRLIDTSVIAIRQRLRKISILKSQQQPSTWFKIYNS